MPRTGKKRNYYYEKKIYLLIFTIEGSKIRE